jgi:hypothetical protein
MNTGVARRGAAELPIMSEIANRGVVKALHSNRRIIAAAIVDHDNFKILVALRKHAVDRPDE